MSYKSFRDETKEDCQWVLKEAATSFGFMPHARSTVDFLRVMERHGLVVESATMPVWFVTDVGRAALDPS
jgi:hypothetical protein